MIALRESAYSTAIILGKYPEDVFDNLSQEEVMEVLSAYNLMNGIADKSPKVTKQAKDYLDRMGYT